jgi:hypothetical protein
VSLVEEELLTLPEHPSSSSVFSGVRATRSVLLRYTILITPLVSSSSSSNSTMCVGAIPKTSDLDRLPCHLKYEFNEVTFYIQLHNNTNNTMIFIYLDVIILLEI